MAGDRSGASGMAALGGGWKLAAPPASGGSRTRIRLVFSHHCVDAAGKQSELGWPYLGYDCEGRVIYIHCVAPNKVFGPGGPTNPYQIRSHAENRKGAALRSLMPLGEPVTTIQIGQITSRVSVLPSSRPEPGSLLSPNWLGVREAVS